MSLDTASLLTNNNKAVQMLGFVRKARYLPMFVEQTQLEKASLHLSQIKIAVIFITHLLPRHNLDDFYHHYHYHHYHYITVFCQEITK